MDILENWKGNAWAGRAPGPASNRGPASGAAGPPVHPGLRSTVADCSAAGDLSIRYPAGRFSRVAHGGNWGRHDTDCNGPGNGQPRQGRRRRPGRKAGGVADSLRDHRSPGRPHAGAQEPRGAAPRGRRGSRPATDRGLHTARDTLARRGAGTGVDSRTDGAARLGRQCAVTRCRARVAGADQRPLRGARRDPQGAREAARRRQDQAGDCIFRRGLWRHHAPPLRHRIRRPGASTIWCSTPASGRSPTASNAYSRCRANRASPRPTPRATSLPA